MLNIKKIILPIFALLSLITILLISLYLSAGNFLVIVVVLIGLMFSFVLLIVSFVRYFRHQTLTSINTVVPEFQLEENKFYELGLLIDGVFRDRDLMSILVYYTLFPPKDPDVVEKVILDHTSPHTISTLRRMLFGGHQTEEELTQNIIGKLKSRLVKPINMDLMQKNLILYNPFKVQIVSLGIFFISIVTYTLGAVLSNSLLNIVATIFLIISIILFSFAHVFYENMNKLVSLQRRVKGYQMYLETVEWYTVEEDKDKFEAYIPFFILFNQKSDKFDDMIEYTLRKLQIG